MQVGQLAEQPDLVRAQLEEVVSWRDPWLSTRVLGAGLYLLICARHFLSGQPCLPCLCSTAQQLSTRHVPP